MNWIGLLLLGVIAGVASGMFGIGGGVVIVPALIGLFGFELTQATGTSLAALLMPVSIFAVLAYYRAGKLTIRTAAWIALGLLISSYIGAEIALGLPTATLQRLYGFFLLYVAWRFAEPRKWIAEIRREREARAVAVAAGSAPPRKGAAVVEEPTPSKGAWYWLFGVGLLAGIFSGMFGIGGGLIIVPVLVALLNFDQKAAVGTSLAALLLPVALPAVLRYYQDGKIDIGYAVLVAVGLLFGAFGGARLALALPTATVKRLYGIFLLVMAIRFIFPELFIPR